MQKVLFLFPPCVPSASNSPYLAPHLLSTILRTKGHEVDNIDLNNRFVARLCHLEVLNEVEKSILRIEENPGSADLTYIRSGIAHIEILRNKLLTNKHITFGQKITLANYVMGILFPNFKTIQDYRDKGLAIDPAVRSVFNAMVDELDINDKVICLSCAFGEQVPFTLELARLIRKKSPQTKILLGGAQISLLPDELIQELSRMKLFNLVFTGFAEETISDVVESCDDAYFTKPVTGTTATHKMLDSLPYTEFDHIEAYENLFLPVMVNKGCYWGRCTFCDYILMGDLGGARYVSRSVEIVYDEIKKLRERFPNSSVSLISDAVPPKFYKELCILANKEDFPLRTYSYMINNKNLTEDFFIEASKARIGLIVFGTESTNDRILELMQKQGRKKDIMDNLRFAQKHNVSVKVNLIPNYPTTTYEEALQTVRHISLYKDSIARLAVFRFYLSANTAMDKAPEDFDLEINQDIPYLKSEHNGFHSREFVKKKGMTKEQEEHIYAMLGRLAFECDLNEPKKYFRSLYPEKGRQGLVFSADFNLTYLSDNKPALYSVRRTFPVEIPVEDFEFLKKIESLPTESEKKAKLSEKSDEWIERYYCLGALDFAS